MDHKIVRLGELDEKHIDQAIEIFIEGFYDIFSKSVSKDKRILHELFKDSLDFNLVYVYLQDDRVIGFLGLGNSQKRAVALKKETCQRLFGKFKGKMLYKQMGYIVEKIMVSNKEEGYIDYITTDARFRGMGIGMQLIQYVCENLTYKYYTLEVLTKNISAIKLYEKVGFRQIKTTANIVFLLNGFGKTAIMKLVVK